MDLGSNGFLLICAALVFIMTPGLAFFYGGLARKKNIVDTMMASVGLMGVSVIMWVCFGYSLCFAPGTPVIGGLQHAFLMGLSPYQTLDGTANSVSIYSYVAFQMMFAMITPAVVTGAGVGRMKYNAMFIFTIIWSIIVYYPLAHMVWGGGFMQKMGVIDFAGGFPIEVTTGISGLVLAIMLGKRDGFGKKSFEPHNKPYVFLGASLLWFGWLGFNAGSSFLADGLASHAFMTTMIIAASALLSWAIIDIAKTGKPTIVGCSSGLVCGLVAATPTCGFVPIWACFIIGAAVSPICYCRWTCFPCIYDDHDHSCISTSFMGDYRYCQDRKTNYRWLLIRSCMRSCSCNSNLRFCSYLGLLHHRCGCISDLLLYNKCCTQETGIR